MLKCMNLHALDKIKLVFIYCRFDISWIRKTVLQTETIFGSCLKYPNLTLTQSVQFIQGYFIMFSLFVYHDLYDFNQEVWGGWGINQVITYGKQYVPTYFISFIEVFS